MKRVILASTLVASLLYAEGSVYDLGRIEVVDKNDVSQNETTETVDAETIKDTESITVVEALQFVPGVTVQQEGKKNLTEIRLRGFDSSRVPIYVDGIPVYVPYNRETDLGRYTTYDISEITVSKGYVSPMFGPNTLGGAVNLITKKPTKKLEGEIGAGVFSGKGHQEFLTIGSNQGDYYGLLSVSNYQRDYFNLSDDFVPAGMEDGGKRENSDSKDTKLNVKVGYTPNATDEYSFNYIMQRAEKGNPFYASDYEGGDEGARKGWRTRDWRWPDWDKTSYYFLSKTVMDDFTLKTRIYYDEFYNKLEDQKYGWTSEYDDHSIGGSAELDYQITKDQIIKLAVFQKNDYHKDISSDDPGLDIEAEAVTRSVGLEYSIKMSDKLKWVVGLSYDTNEIQEAEYRNNEGGISSWPNYDTDILSPQTALYYAMSDATTLYTAIGRRSNLPTLQDRYSSGFGDAVPNPDLEAELSMNYEVGIEQEIGNDHFIKSALFYTETKDYIDSVYVDAAANPVFCEDPEESCTQYQNIGSANYFGFEIAGDSYWSENFTTNVSYTYVDAELKEANDPEVKYITAIPEHTFSVRAKYTPFSKLSIVPIVRGESSRYVDNTVSTPKTRSFIIMDLKAAYNVTKAIEISAGINNITDEYYYYTEGYPTEGRNYYATARYTF